MLQTGVICKHFGIHFNCPHSKGDNCWQRQFPSIGKTFISKLSSLCCSLLTYSWVLSTIIFIRDINSMLLMNLKDNFIFVLRIFTIYLSIGRSPLFLKKSNRQMLKFCYWIVDSKRNTLPNYFLLKHKRYETAIL